LTLSESRVTMRTIVDELGESELMFATTLLTISICLLLDSQCAHFPELDAVSEVDILRNMRTTQFDWVCACCQAFDSHMKFFEHVVTWLRSVNQCMQEAS